MGFFLLTLVTFFILYNNLSPPYINTPFFVLQSVCADWWRVYARRETVGSVKAQPHRSVLPHIHHVLCRHMERSPLHPLLHHPYRPRSRHASQIGLARRRVHRCHCLFLHPAFLDL